MNWTALWSTLSLLPEWVVFLSKSNNLWRSLVSLFFYFYVAKCDQILTELQSKSGHVTRKPIFVDAFVCFKFFYLYLHEIVQMSGKEISDGD